MTSFIFLILVFIARLFLNIQSASSLIFNTPLIRLSSIAIIFSSFLIMNLSLIYFNFSFLGYIQSSNILNYFSFDLDLILICSIIPIKPRLSLPLNPQYVTGLCDGDANFGLGVYANTTSKLGYSVILTFTITAGINPANYNMLINIKDFFGGIGYITTNNTNNSHNYVVSNLKDLLIIQQHFLNYPLLTYKLVHFNLWSAVLNMLITEGKLNLDLINIIVGYRAHFKLGISEALLNAFPNYIKLAAPVYLPDLSNMNMHWLAGFIYADGSFSLSVNKTPRRTLGEACIYYISITQNDTSKIVLDHIIQILEAGFIYSQAKGVFVYKMRSIKDINNFIIKLEEEGARFLGAKALDYSDFCKGIKIVNNKGHLTREGLESIRTISKNMNSNRTYFGD
jgi:LAGLIDADG endonuclease